MKVQNAPKPAGVSSPIRSIDSRSLVDQVEFNLIEFFVENKLQPGDPIPKELELAESMKVSRTVIREALIRLKMIGLIDTKKHRGAVITNPDLLTLLSKSLNPHILDEGTLKDIFELRLVIEIGMGDLIFDRATPKDIEELKQIAAEYPVATETMAFNIAHEIKFHGKLYEITGNNTLIGFQNKLLPIFQYVNDSGILEKPVRMKKYVSHKGLVDIIENGTPELFRNAMRNHLENHFQRLVLSEHNASEKTK